MPDSNLAPSAVGDMERLMRQFFRGSLTGQGEGAAQSPVTQNLFSLGQGILPKPMQDWITASTNEQFGKMGNRFGTDLGTAVSRGLGQAGASQSLDAIGKIMGLGGTTAGFEFQRSENSLNRALQEYLGNLQSDSSMQILQLLLGSGMI